MSVFSKILESLGKTISKELENLKQSSAQAMQEYKAAPKKI